MIWFDLKWPEKGWYAVKKITQSTNHIIIIIIIIIIVSFNSSITENTIFQLVTPNYIFVRSYELLNIGERLKFVSPWWPLFVW